MKKLAWAIIGCWAMHAYALPLGNPREPALMREGLFWERFGECCCDPLADLVTAVSFRTGFYGDYVFDRRLETERGTLRRSQVFTNAGYLVLNLFDSVDIFGTLGATKISFYGRESLFGSDFGRQIELHSGSRFSYSLGGRAILLQCGCLTIGAEGQYFRTKPQAEVIIVGEKEIVVPEADKWFYHEYQLGAGLTYQIGNFFPYLGGKWSKAVSSFSNTLVPTTDITLDLPNFISRLNAGFVAGLTYLDCKTLTLTVEGRWADEKALYVNAQFRY